MFVVCSPVCKLLALLFCVLVVFSSLSVYDRLGKCVMIILYFTRAVYQSVSMGTLQ